MKWFVVMRTMWAAAVCITPAISGGSDRLICRSQRARPDCRYQLQRLAHHLFGSGALLYESGLGSRCVRIAGALGPASHSRISLSAHADQGLRCPARAGCEGDGPQPLSGPCGDFVPASQWSAGCIHCGFCNGYGCEVNAKSSSLVTVIPVALATGNCELRTHCTVHRVNTNDQGRATEVVYWDADGVEQAQRAKAVVLCANGSETPRLLLMSESAQHPDGLANSSGMVGKNLMFNGYSTVMGLFDEPVNAYKSVPATRVVHDFYELDPSLGFYGGGGIDGRHPSRGAPMGFALTALLRLVHPPGAVNSRRILPTSSPMLRPSTVTRPPCH